MLLDGQRRLLGTVTDGDIRRAILAGIDLEQPVKVLLEQPRPVVHATPLTAQVGTSASRLLQMMNEAEVRHMPLVNESGQVEDVVVLSDLVRDYELPLTAVVMAGGFGTRLRPLTDDLPKPMLPLGDRPLLEHIVDQLRTAGVRKVNITTHYKGHLIERHFGDGGKFGLDIRYVNEQTPLGTAGALHLVETSDEPVLVINGDIVTRVDLRAILDFHTEHSADMPVVVRQEEIQIPYGVIDIDGIQVVSIDEKPTKQYLINAGIYLLNPDICRNVPSGRHYDMTDLIGELTADGRRVIAFPVQEYWLDVGQQDDYSRAQADVIYGDLP